MNILRDRGTPRAVMKKGDRGLAEHTLSEALAVIYLFTLTYGHTSLSVLNNTIEMPLRNGSHLEALRVIVTHDCIISIKTSSKHR